MNVTKKQLNKLPVVTQSGQKLGEIHDYELDPQTQKIVKYYVKSAVVLKDLFAKELVISCDQVISITKEQMVVEDGVIKERVKEEEVVKRKVVFSPTE